MNAPVVHRSILKRHVALIEEKHPLTILGLLPRGAAAHVEGDDAVDLLAEKKVGLDLLRLCEVEAELGVLLGRPVGIVLKSGLESQGSTNLVELADPL